MSILIKGMEMPTNCYDCPLAMQYYVTLFGKTFKQTKNAYACVLTHKKITSTRRNRFCPLVPVPPHGRLIDADALRTAMYHEAFETDTPMQKWDSGCWIRYKMFERVEESAPTIIPAKERET